MAHGYIIGKKNFKLKKDNQILVIDKTIKRDNNYHNQFPGVVHCFEFIPTKKETHLILGILNKNIERLISESTSIPITFPTSEYLERIEPFSPFNDEEKIDGWIHKKGNIRIPLNVMSNNIIYLNEKSIRKELKHKDGTFILTGDEVPEYFSSYDKNNSFLENKIDLSYVIAMNMLKQKIPNNHKELFERELDKRALKIYSIISKLEGVKGNLKEEIEHARKISEMPKSGIIEGDKVFFGLSTYNDREKVDSIKSDVKYFIKEAFNLGLDKRDLKVELKSGLILDFPVYLKSLCEKYNYLNF